MQRESSSWAALATAAQTISALDNQYGLTAEEVPPSHQQDDPNRAIMTRMSDQKKFAAELYNEYSARIYRFLVWQTSNEELAEDIMGEVFLRAWKNCESVEKLENKQAWLYRVAKNLVTDHWRKKRTVSLEETDHLPSTHDVAKEAVANDQAQHLRGLIAELPEDMKTVIILRFFEHLSGEEVAEIMKKTPVNVRVLQYRALKLLKHNLGEL